MDHATPVDPGLGRVLALFEKLRYNPPNLLRVVEELAERFAADCRDQEALMAARGFPDQEPHMLEHRALAAHFGGPMLEDLLGAHGHAALLAHVESARQMLLDHMALRDADLAAHLVEAPRAVWRPPAGRLAWRGRRGRRACPGAVPT